MTAVPKPDREFCSVCGWPIRSIRCEACGSERTTLELRDAPDDEAFVPASGGPGLEKAAEAFQNKEWTRYVGAIVAAEGGSNFRTVASPEGPGWIARIAGGLVFVSLHSAAGPELVVEAPLGHLPMKRRVAALRACLELGKAHALAARVCLRDDLVLLRLAARVWTLTPTLARRALRETGELARTWGEALCSSYGARPAFASNDWAGAGWETIGTTRKLAKAIVDANGAFLPREEPQAKEAEPEEPEPDSIPAILAFGGPSRKDPTIPPPPKKPSLLPPAPPPPAPPALKFPAQAATPLRNADGRKPTLQEPAMARADGRTATLELEAVSGEFEAPDKRKSMPPPPPSEGVVPAERLVGLLSRAQALATLVTATNPETLPWIVRAGVFRAVYDFRETMPDAVALLYRTAGMAARDGAATVEPQQGLTVFERLVAAKGSTPKEKPLEISPLTTAQQAKEHVGKYVLEIDRGPGEPTVRHFLALGALSELLVRAKLPQQTGQRLRDIVAHAQREGAKAASIDLLMTALKRISA